MKSADLAGKLQHNGNFINLVLLLMFWPGCTMTSACHEPHFHILNDIFRNNVPILPIWAVFIDDGGDMLLFCLFWWHPPKFLILFQHLNHQEHEQYKGLVLKRVFEKKMYYIRWSATKQAQSCQNLYWMTECPIGVGAKEGLASNVFSPDLVFSCSFYRT